MKDQQEMSVSILCHCTIAWYKFAYAPTHIRTHARQKLFIEGSVFVKSFSEHDWKKGLFLARIKFLNLKQQPTKFKKKQSLGANIHLFR